MTSNEQDVVAGFATGGRLLSAVRSTVALGQADVAVAFWGPEAVDLLQMPADARSIRVACDAFSGACSPKALGELLRRGARVYDSPGLHAKVYLGNGTLVVGSANASANGFGQHIPENGLDLEAASVSRQADDLAEATRWLRRIYREGNVLTAADLPRIQEARDGTPSAIRLRPRPSFFDMLAREPDWFAGRRLRVCMYDSDEPTDAVQRAYRESEFFTTQEEVDEVGWPYYWSTQDWEVSEGDLILDFIRHGKKVGCTGVWRVLGQADGGDITAVEYVPAPLSLKFPKSDMSRLGTSVTRRGLFTDDRGWKLLDVVPFARGLGDSTGAEGHQSKSGHGATRVDRR